MGPRVPLTRRTLPWIAPVQRKRDVNQMGSIGGSAGQVPVGGQGKLRRGRAPRMTTRTPMRRVLLIAPQPFYEDRGTPIAVRHVAIALSQLGWLVDILTYGVGRDFESPGIRVFRFGTWLRFKTVPIGLSIKKVLLDSAMPWAIWQQLRSNKYDCVHAVEEAVYPALVLGGMAGTPVIYDMQSSIAEQLSMHPLIRFLRVGRLFDWIERLACTKAAYVVCSAGLAKKCSGMDGKKIASEWTFPGSGEEVAWADRTRIRRELNIPASSRVVMYTGNFEHYQGIPTLLEAAPLIIAAFPAAVLVLVGAEAEDLHKLSSQWPKLIEEEKLILIPRQSRQRVRQLLSIADVAVSPRASGSNFPLKVFDYLDAGLPVVASDIAAHRAPAATALIMVPPTPRGIADGILSVLRDHQLAERCRQKAREISAKQLAWPKFCEQVGDIYAAALANAGAKSAPGS